MSEGEGDIAVVLSSELIAKITQEYFNKVMFKQKVEIVDLKPASDGYMFSVAFVKEVKPTVEHVGIQAYPHGPDYDEYKTGADREMSESIGRLVQSTVARASNGKFAKKEKV